MLKKMDAEKFKNLEDKISELEKMCEKHKKQLSTHEQMLIKAAKIISAMDKNMGPVYEFYIKEIERVENEKVNKAYE